ncbi:ArsR/SmtB family transcription factor [Chthonobacter rhizosphaerae]|uniref:ArsR/SmtB family transcription factor n=1 Tax=Chthonobacter rhizosphaerae TaxID=2735553 RepID=UPI0015EFB2BF|nr:metalloregulator ArsR/SmtB family transcription factor [Chthonobacter rhizosphaerae]
MKQVATHLEESLSGIAYQNRLLMMGLLARGPMNVGQITKALDLPQPTVSQNLARMKELGLIKSEVDGRSRVYRLDRNGIELLKTRLEWLLDTNYEPSSAERKDSHAQDGD